jgi:pyruvate carboxylase
VRLLPDAHNSPRFAQLPTSLVGCYTSGPDTLWLTHFVTHVLPAGDLSSPTETKFTLDYYMDMAEQIVSHGCHAIGIKDMAGLLKPPAATTLISALRSQYPDVVLHVHTHDSAGTAVATQLAAAAAGADIVDLAMDAMSGCTSQGSMGAVVATLQGSALDTGLNLNDLNRMSVFWEQTRGLYSPFESSMRSSSADVYYHEMPGGQYTNLKFQSLSLGVPAATLCMLMRSMCCS